MSNYTIARRCEAAAPLVVNGAAFVGCQKDFAHEGQHEVRVMWSGDSPRATLWEPHAATPRRCICRSSGACSYAPGSPCAVCNEDRSTCTG